MNMKPRNPIPHGMTVIGEDRLHQFLTTVEGVDLYCHENRRHIYAIGPDGDFNRLSYYDPSWVYATPWMPDEVLAMARAFLALTQ